MISSIPSGLIVSCQAPADSPLHDREIIAVIAQTAVMRGAVGVRIDSPAHVEAVRKRISEPIIGLWKRQIPGYSVYITPQFEDAAAIATAGADIIAIDATLRKRPGGETVSDLIAQIHEKLGKLVMADIDTLDAAIAAIEAGADVVGTTLYGYTEATQNLSPPAFELLEVLAKRADIPVICEGGIASPEMAKRAIALGADAIVVGTAITGIDYLVEGFNEAVKAAFS